MQIDRKKRIFFYSSVKDKSLFQTQRFYSTDIMLLENVGYNVCVTNRLTDFLYFWKYDIAFIYFYRYGFIAGFLAKLFLKPVFFTGGIDALEESLAGRKAYLIQVLFFKLCYWVATSCIIVSKSDWNNIQKIYRQTNKQKLVYSQHTINIDNFREEDISKEKIFTTVVWMETKGNVIRKGVDIALEVFAFLIQQEEFRGYKFVIMGREGKGTEYLKDLCDKLQIADNVVFTGEVNEENKINILKSSKYYFQLSLYEGFGIAAVEAMAACNIVIHSGRGGLRDTMGEYGIQTDLAMGMEAMCQYIYSQLLMHQSYDTHELFKYIYDHFSNEKRQNNLERILSNKDI